MVSKTIQKKVRLLQLVPRGGVSRVCHVSRFKVAATVLDAKA
jgi:hypothetical protein